MTYFQAALTVLAYAEHPLTVGELTSVAVAENLIRPRGRTPDRSMSSVLYRHMVATADARIICEHGRFWLRGRAFGERRHDLLGHPRQRSIRRAPEFRQAGGPQHERRESALPPPPFTIPVLDLPAVRADTTRSTTERAVLRLDAGLERLHHRLALPWQSGEQWDADRTHDRLVRPLLTMLGYRRSDRFDEGSARGRRSLVLQVAGRPAILLESCGTGHALAGGEARPACERARAYGVAWVLLTNGRELRLHAVPVALSGAQPSSAPVLRLRLFDWVDEAARLEVARLLWLLTSSAVGAGSLDSYLAARAVGAALLEALDDPESELVATIDRAVSESTGLHFSAATLARQVRLAIRGRRSRDGEPLPRDVAELVAGRLEGLSPSVDPSQAQLAAAV